MHRSPKGDFCSINQLEIAYAYFQPATVAIYANVNNQVAVIARVRPEVQNGSPVSVPVVMVKNVLYLYNLNVGGKFR